MLYRVPDVESRSDEEQIMAHALELFRSHGRNSPRTQDYWTATARRVAEKHASPIQGEEVTRGGSWNHPIAGAVLIGLMEQRDWEVVRRYCVSELDGTHKGFWGTESMSHIYPQPITSLAVAFEVNPMPEVQKVLRAHAFLLALQALPRPYTHEAGERREDGESAFRTRSLPFQVCCGGMRSQWPYRGNVYLTYALSILLAANAPAIPTWRRTNERIQGWPFRIMRHTSHDYLSREDRQLLANHVDTPNPRPIVDELRSLGVTSRARLEIARYPQGQGYSFFATNTHASTPPLMGQSLVGGDYHTLGLHPENLRGTPGGNKVGRVSAERRGNAISGRAEGVVAGGNVGNWPPIDGTPPARGNVTASIPIPAGEPLYRVVVDRQGIRIEGGPDPQTPGPLPPPPTPTGRELNQALSLIDQAVRGVTLEQPARTGAEVLRRILRGDAEGGAKGARTLVRTLEAAPQAQAQLQDPRLTQALVLIDRAILGAALEQHARTAAEVLRRIFVGNRDGALQGARTLLRLFA